MNKIGFLIMILWIGIWGCTRDVSVNEEEEKGIVKFNIGFGLDKGGQTRAPQADEITLKRALDSLIQDVRILVFNSAGVCEGYADYAPLTLSEMNTLTMTCQVGAKNFVFVSNVCVTGAMRMPVIGRTKSQILVELPEYLPGNLSLRMGAQNYFFGEVAGVTVTSGVNLTYPVELWRMEGRMETKVAVNNIWLQKQNGGDSVKVTAGYIKRLRSITVWYTSPDINMLQGVNNDPFVNSDSVVVVDTLWRKIGMDTLYNQIQLFPTTSIAKPGFFAVLYAAEVDTSYAEFKASPADMLVPGGGVVRYWWLPVRNYPIRRNVRLLFAVTKLKGAGSPYLPDHKPEMDADFTVTVRDWEPIADFIEGNMGDFYQ